MTQPLRRKQATASSSTLETLCPLKIEGVQVLNRELLRQTERADILSILVAVSRRSGTHREDDYDYSAFGNLWRAFNAWTRAVTGRRANDASQVLAAGRDSQLNQRFNQLLGKDAEFATAAHGFQNLWPIFSETWLKERDIDLWGAAADKQGRKLTRSQYRALCFKEKPPENEFRPRCYAKHQIDVEMSGGDPERVELNWPHTLQAIYMVRCNLVHDLKGTYARAVKEDSRFIGLSHDLLWSTWAESLLTRTKQPY